MNKTCIKEARGELAIQTLAMPANTNANGDIFGGWLVSQMDLAGAVVGKIRSNSRVVTVAIDSMIFHLPVSVGDLICCYTDIIKVGRTSMTINIEAWRISMKDHTKEKVTEGVFTYVAIDDRGKPRAVDREH